MTRWIRAMRSILFLMHLCVLVGLVVPGVVSARDWPRIELVDYTIVKGDTCAAVARKFYKNDKRYDLIHRFNPQLGKRLPHHLEPGAVLRLPPEIPPDAWVTLVIKNVDHRTPSSAGWKPTRVGAKVRTGDRIATRKRSNAELIFQDQTRLEILEDTLVLVMGRTAKATQRETVNVILKMGGLRSHLPAAGRVEAGQLEVAKMQISSSSALASFSGGDSLMSIDTDGMSSISNHSGGSAVVSSPSAPSFSVEVKPGMGTRVKKGQRPSKPKPLLKPPTPKLAKQTQVGLLATDAVIRMKWALVKGARRYRVEICGDAKCAVRMGGAILPAKTPLRSRGFSSGTYFIRISSIDADGLEGLRSTAQQVTISALGEGTLSVGTTVDLPHGASCAIGDGPANGWLKFEAAGRHTVRCVQSDGAELSPINVTVEP